VKKGTDGEFDTVSLVRLDRNRRYFVATTGNTQPGNAVQRVRLRETPDGPHNVEITVQQRNLVELYYSCCAEIFRHNRCRQNDLMLEKKLRTHRWDFRLNCSLLGMIIVDAWNMYSGVQGVREKL